MRITKRPPSSSTALRRRGRLFWACRSLVVLIGSLSPKAQAAAAAAAAAATKPTSSSSRRSRTTTTAADLAESQLLFWSLHDCAIDAALQFLGPIDIFLRGAGVSASPDVGKDNDDEDDENQWALFASSSSSPSSIHTNASVEDASDVCDDDNNSIITSPQEEQEERLEQQQHQHAHSAQALFAKGRAIVRDLKKNVSISSSKTTTTTIADSSVFDVTSSASSSSSSSSAASSLEVRGGGPRDWGGSGKYVFSLFQKGDGSETDPDGLPKRYLDMHGGNRDLAKASLQATLDWRREYSIDTILRDPHPKYDICKQVFPHYFLGRGSTDGRVILMQRPALLNMKMAEQNKLTKQQLLMHYVYVNEYLWQVVEASSPLQMMTSVIDLTGLDLSVLRQRDNIAFLKLFVATMDSHYPQRAHKTLLLNAPKWFSTLYKLLSPFLREATKAKIEIHQRGTKKQDDAIRKYLGPQATDFLPPSFFSVNKNSSNKNKNNSSSTKTSSLPFWKRKRQAQVQQQDNNDDDGDDDVENNSDEETSRQNNNNDSNTTSKKPKLTREEEKERLRNEAPPIVSRLEEDLRTFTLQRLKDAGKSMQKVI